MKPHLHLLAKLGACGEAHAFARTCPDLETAWNTCDRSEWMIWLLRKLKFQDDKTYRLYACWCVRNTPMADGRKVWDLLTDPRSRNAVEVAERFAVGEATADELREARIAAYAAAVYAAVYAYAAAAADAAAAYAAPTPPPTPPSPPAADAAAYAADAAAYAADAAAARLAARKAQAQQLARWSRTPLSRSWPNDLHPRNRPRHGRGPFPNLPPSSTCPKD